MPCPSTAAMVDTKISGRVVATLMMVAPMINLGMRVISAAHTAPSTNQSPPFTMSTMPTANSTYIRILPIFFLLHSLATGTKKAHGALSMHKKLHAQCQART